MPTRKPAEFDPIQHFLAFASRLILDTGAEWDVEDFQIVMFTPLLTGVRETWNIIPEGNTKTTSSAGFALYHCMFTRAPWVPIVASSRDQAEILAQQAYGIIRATPGLEYNKRRHTGYFEILEGYRQIRCPRSGGRGIKVYAADVSTSDGGIPTLVLCDEGHRWPDLGPYRLWKGKLGKRKDLPGGGGQIAMNSTAGEPGTEFEEQRDKIRAGATKRTINGYHGHYEGHQIVMNEWMVDKREHCEDMERVKMANPFSGITVETLADESPAVSLTTDLGDWVRLKCNIAARSSQSAITESEWAKAYANFQIPEGEHMDAGVDVAWKHDTFAIAPLWRFNASEYTEMPEQELLEWVLAALKVNKGKSFRLLGPPKILTPPRDGSTMHPDVVKIAFTELMDRNPIDTVVIDIERAEDIAAWLEDENDIEVIDRSTGNAMAVEDYDAFIKGLRTGILRHNGDPGLRKHVMNAVVRTLPGEKKRFDRASTSRAKRKQEVRVIDALTAAGMINWHWDNYIEDSGEPLVSWR